MIKASSTIKMNFPRIRQLSAAAVTALEMTGEKLKEEIINAQVIPFAKTTYKTERVYGKRGQFAKNGREYKGKEVKKVQHEGGQLKDSTFVDFGNSKEGKVSIVNSTPYARRLYFHPEYNFFKGEHPNAKGNWFEDWEKGGSKEDFAKNAYKKFYKQQGGV